MKNVLYLTIYTHSNDSQICCIRQVGHDNRRNFHYQIGKLVQMLHLLHKMQYNHLRAHFFDANFLFYCCNLNQHLANSILEIVFQQIFSNFKATQIVIHTCKHFTLHTWWTCCRSGS